MASVGAACNSVLLKWTTPSPSPSSSRSLQIVCGGKRSNAPSLRRKSLRSKQQQQQSTTAPLPDDILLGVGPGASSLPALQPLPDLNLDPDPDPDLDLSLPLPPSSSYGGSAGSSLESGKKDKTGTKTPLDRVKGRKNEREEESEWVEVDEEEEEGEEKELVEYWEGDGPPLTPEEEAELLREAEEELAGLEKSQGKVWGQITSKQRKSFKSNLSRRRQQQQQQQKSGVAGNDLASFESMDFEEEDDISAVGRNIAIAERDVSDGFASFELMEYEEDDVFLTADRNIADVHSNGLASFELMESQVEEDMFFVNNGNIADVNSSIQNSNSQQGFDVGYWESGDGDNFDDGPFDETEMDSAEMRPRERKNIPAVMRCFDRAKIYAKAGDGGNGVVAFRREKYVPFGGPSGGSGGNGGNVYVEADPGMNSLLPFRKCVHFRADRGSHGQGKSQIGANGSPCVVKVPVGTIIREAAGHGLAEPGEVLLELTRPGQRELLLPGGRGGRGNTAFKSFRNKAPQIAENGETGAEMWLELELKLVADIGIIGVPNAGKSTLLSVISAAKPAIANYPFTTLLPNLGVVSIGFESSMVVADLPGLLEGAHVGVGLGHEFLRHTERCRVLVHVVDGTGPQPELEYEAVRLELQLFNPSLINKPCIVAFNKMDIPEAASRWKSFQTYLQKKGVETLSMSAATGQGTSEVVQKAYSLFQSLKVDDNFKEDDDTRDLQVGDWVKKQRSAPVDQFKISADKHTRTYMVNGIGVERFAQMTNWEYFEAARRFQHVLTLSGINKALKEEGVREGDSVIIGEMEFMWHDNEDFENPKGWKRGTRGSKVWPH